MSTPPLKHRPAQIYAATVEVCCPYCGACYPSPDNGSDAWMPHQVVGAEQQTPILKCVECDVEFRVIVQGKAMVRP